MSERATVVAALSSLLGELVSEALGKAAEQAQLLTVPQLANRWAIGETLAWRMVNEGKLPVAEIEGAVRVSVADADAYVAKAKVVRRPRRRAA